MPLKISPESPLSEDGIALIEGSQRALLEVFPPDEVFSFSPDELAGSDTTFYVARAEGRAVGCVALVNCGEYGEIKRLYVDSAARGMGAARALIARLEEDAKAAGLPAIKMETGEDLIAAMALYRALGYRDCPAFGTYPDIPSNAFLQKML